MKLLDKKTVGTQVAGQRKKHIDEGVMIAGKIDNLRQTLGSLEQAHRKKLDSMYQEERNVLTGLEQGIEAKKRELVEIEERRQKALEPLDTLWEVYREERKKLEEEQEFLTQRRGTLTLYSQELSEREKKVAQKEEEIKETILLLDKQKQEACKASLEAQNTFLKAREEEDKILLQLAQKKKDLDKFEESLLVKERELSIKEMHLTKEQENIINTKIQLEDQRKTLQRALKKHAPIN